MRLRLSGLKTRCLCPSEAKVLGNSLAPLQIFSAILHSAFSAASKLRTTVHDIRRMFSFITGLASFSCLVLKHLGRLTSSTSLKGRVQKAKSSMVASAIPQNLIVKREKRNRARSALLTVFLPLSLRLELKRLLLGLRKRRTFSVPTTNGPQPKIVFCEF